MGLSRRFWYILAVKTKPSIHWLKPQAMSTRWMTVPHMRIVALGTFEAEEWCGVFMGLKVGPKNSYNLW